MEVHHVRGEGRGSHLTLFLNQGEVVEMIGDHEVYLSRKASSAANFHGRCLLTKVIPPRKPASKNMYMSGSYTRFIVAPVILNAESQINTGIDT